MKENAERSADTIQRLLRSMQPLKKRIEVGKKSCQELLNQLSDLIVTKQKPLPKRKMNLVLLNTILYI